MRMRRCEGCGLKLKECTCEIKEKPKAIIYCGVTLSTGRPCPGLFDIGFLHQDRRRENRCHPCNNRIMASCPIELEKSKEVISNFPGGAMAYFNPRDQL